MKPGKGVGRGEELVSGGPCRVNLAAIGGSFWLFAGGMKKTERVLIGEKVHRPGKGLIDVFSKTKSSHRNRRGKAPYHPRRKKKKLSSPRPSGTINIMATEPAAQKDTPSAAGENVYQNNARELTSKKDLLQEDDALLGLFTSQVPEGHRHGKVSSGVETRT